MRPHLYKRPCPSVGPLEEGRRKEESEKMKKFLKMKKRKCGSRTHRCPPRSCFINLVKLKQDPEVNNAFSSHFFIFHFVYNFFIFSLSSSLLPPRRSLLLAPPSSSPLLPLRPALSQSLRIHKRPFFIDFDKSVTDRRTNGRTDGPTDGRTHAHIESLRLQ